MSINLTPILISRSVLSLVITIRGRDALVMSCSQTKVEDPLEMPQ